MRQGSQQNHRALALALAVVLLQTGCASLTEIRDFAALAKTASESFPPMIRDMRASFLRQRETQNIQLGQSLDEAAKQASADCDQSDICSNVPDIIGAGRVLENYMKVMGQLAAGDLASHDVSIKKFADELKTSAKIKEKERDAIKSVAAFLLNAVTRGYRQRHLAETLARHNEDIGSLTTALISFVADYEVQLATEEQALRSYYESALTGRPAEEPMKILIYDLYGRDRLEFEQKRRAAAEYRKFLQTLQATHDKLASQSSKLSATEVRRFIANSSVEIDKQVQIFREAF